MKTIISKIWTYKQLLLWFPWTLYINFKKLPLKQAVRIPIIFFKPYFGKLSGKVVIEGGKVRLDKSRYSHGEYL